MKNKVDFLEQSEAVQLINNAACFIREFINDRVDNSWRYAQSTDNTQVFVNQCYSWCESILRFVKNVNENESYYRTSDILKSFSDNYQRDLLSKGYVFISAIKTIKKNNNIYKNEYDNWIKSAEDILFNQ